MKTLNITEIATESRLIFYPLEFELRSFKSSAGGMEGTNSLMGFLCFMFPWIIGMIDGLDPCLN